MKFLVFLLVSCFCINTSFALEADWSLTSVIPASGHRKDIFNVGEEKLKTLTQKGYLHALKYPVTVTGAFLPIEPFRYFMESNSKNPIRRLIQSIARKKMPFSSMKQLYNWLGLAPYNNSSEVGIYKIPYPDGVRPEYPMGASLVDTQWGKALTFSCATCHASSFFGKSIMGLTNKRVRANHFFVFAKQYIPYVTGGMFQFGTRANNQEKEMYVRTRSNLPSVGAIAPQVLGLDTSLPQIALSFARRADDDYASKSKHFEKNPRKNRLETFVADSKASVWWNLKYKTRWLSDGSIIKGNPVYTNFLWNEIGRGTDLKELEGWINKSSKIVDEITAALFATEAPIWTDFFSADRINISRAKNGEKYFNQTCRKCHGSYTKAWSLPESELLSPAEQIKTTRVRYFKRTPIKNVGTDPQRYQATQYFSDSLNKLSISKSMGVIVKPQKGYVPPPLVGIFSRYPYMHNNSIPTLCDVLKNPAKRTKIFYQGPSVDKETDYDFECVGYPTGNSIPSDWIKEEDALFDTSKPGLKNTGHFKNIMLTKDGVEKYTAQEKQDIIEYLKTL
ncbi:MAG: hypothetical protein HN576_00925 [Bacteriovoracaceae bacterium]|nr:hypothetical protein [Bacteriovoracaceae bacterium]